MKLTITGKKLDTQAFANVLSQGEKGVEYVEIVADRYYEGTDLTALTWEMWGTYTRYESTAELAVPCVADGDDKVTFTWQPNEFYTIYPGPEELTLVGSDADGNKILKIVGTTPILVRENERKTSSIIIPAQVSNIEQAVNQCTQSATAAASSAGAAATSATAAQTAQTAAEAAQATAETEAAAAAASAALALQISQQNKGWYPSATALAAAHPTGINGDWALVGGDVDTIWMWDSDGAAWKNTHQQTDLSNYYTKTQADTQFATAAQGTKADNTELELNPTGFTTAGLTFTNATLLDGGYVKLGKIVVLQIRLQVTAAVSTSAAPIAGLPNANYTTGVNNLILCNYVTDTKQGYVSNTGQLAIYGNWAANDIIRISGIYICQ